MSMIPLSLDPNGEREAVKPVEECARALCNLYSPEPVSDEFGDLSARERAKVPCHGIECPHPSDQAWLHHP